MTRRAADDAAAGGPHVEVQYAIARRGLPPVSLVERAVAAAVAGVRPQAELTVRMVGLRESRRLNRLFRGIDRPTNVLSFVATGIDDIAPDYLGDIALCAPLVQREASAQGKSRAAHFAHLVVHGVLHLLGYDHGAEADAVVMEKREREVLSSLGIADPYRA